MNHIVNSEQYSKLSNYIYFLNKICKYCLLSYNLDSIFSIFLSPDYMFCNKFHNYGITFHQNIDFLCIFSMNIHLYKTNNLLNKNSKIKCLINNMNFGIEYIFHLLNIFHKVFNNKHMIQSLLNNWFYKLYNMLNLYIISNLKGKHHNDLKSLHKNPNCNLNT